MDRPLKQGKTEPFSSSARRSIFDSWFQSITVSFTKYLD